MMISGRVVVITENRPYPLVTYQLLTRLKSCASGGGNVRGLTLGLTRLMRRIAPTKMMMIARTVTMNRLNIDGLCWLIICIDFGKNRRKAASSNNGMQGTMVNQLKKV